MSTSAREPASDAVPRQDDAPDLAATLARIEARLERIERATAPAAELSRELPNVLATVVDTLDEKAEQLGDVEQRLQALGGVLERLTRPQTLAAVQQLVDVAEQAPALLAIFVDVADELMDGIAAEGVELTHLGDDARALLVGLIKNSSGLRALLESDALDARALGTLGDVASALAEVSGRPATRVGALGLLRALGQQDVQRALGFLLQLAQSFGRRLGEADAPKKLTGG